MTDFERATFYYNKGWASKSQVGMYVFYKKITAEEYKIITGDVYEKK